MDDIPEIINFDGEPDLLAEAIYRANKIWNRDRTQQIYKEQSAQTGTPMVEEMAKFTAREVYNRFEVIPRYPEVDNRREAWRRLRQAIRAWMGCTLGWGVTVLFFKHPNPPIGSAGLYPRRVRKKQAGGAIWKTSASNCRRWGTSGNRDRR